MEFNPKAPRNAKLAPLILSVLNIPNNSDLKQIKSSETQISLWQWVSKKMTLSCYKLHFPKTKLLNNLEIYEWRHQTQFPIVKASFVSVRQNQMCFSQVSEVFAYVEYCPLKMRQIYEMAIGQALYMLKQSLLGFQRLYNKFGAFQVLSSMIAVNQKGKCRVWMNQNFGMNSCIKRQLNEKKMVSKIITIIQAHSQQSRASKKIFTELLVCETFLQALRAVDKVVRDYKLFLPKKFISNYPAQQVLKKQLTPDKNFFNLSGTPNITSRFSIKNQPMYNLRESIKNTVKFSPFKVKKVSLSPLQFRRIKTDYAIQKISIEMKNSDETAYTSINRNKTHNMDNFGESFKSQESLQQNNQPVLYITPRKMDHWNIQMEESLTKEQLEKQHHKLRHSQLCSYQRFSNSPQKRKQQRKYSFKLKAQTKKQNQPSTYEYFTKKSVEEPYFSEFQNLLNSESNDRKEQQFQKILEQDDDSFIKKVKGKVIKQNGWMENVGNLDEIAGKLELSFDQENGDETFAKREFKFNKLDKVGRKEVHQSIIGEDYVCQVYI